MKWYMIDYLQRHMIFHNQDLKYNRISFNLNIEVMNVEKNYLTSLFKEAKMDNLKIIEKLPLTEIIFTEEIKFNQIHNKTTQFLDSEHCILINKKYVEVKNEYNEILKLLNLYLITPSKVEYKENYYII